MPRKTIALVGALDTKGPEYAFAKSCIEASGLATLVIDVGTFPARGIVPDITRDEVAKAAGADPKALAAGEDRGAAVAAMSRGISELLPRLYSEGRFDGVLALGGSGGTVIACSGMRALPIGVPKVMVSTLAGTDVSPYVGPSDIVMVPSIVDVSGINRISRVILSRAAGAVCGMVLAEVPAGEDKPVVVASMFGNTTPAVQEAQRILEAAGYEVVVFHATGTGGRAMEALIESGLVAGVLDITTTEWADELVGGVLSAGPTRLEAAARNGVPAVVVPGCLDMANFWAPDTVPEKFRDRLFYPHNPNVTLMRTHVEENKRLGEILAEKINGSVGPITVLIPLGGVSMLDSEDGQFWDPEADGALFEALKKDLRPDIPAVEYPMNINDPEFARACAEALMEQIGKSH